jgi:hypothetical protein
MEENAKEGSENRRPKAGTALGVLNIIFCGFGLLGGIFGIIAFTVVRGVFGIAMAYEPELQVVMTTMSAFFTIILVITIVQFLINGAGLTAGIGLLGSKRWSILLSNIYAIATIVLLAANFIIVRQLMERIFENPMIMSEMSAQDMMALQTMKRIVPLLAGTFSLILGSAYPVILLALLNRRKVKDYYLGEQGS